MATVSCKFYNGSRGKIGLTDVKGSPRSHGPHRGQDISGRPVYSVSDKNKTVYCPCACKVVEAKWDDSWGNYIKARITEGTLNEHYFLVAHLMYPVKHGVNALLKRADIIGKEGDTGSVSGSNAYHAHIELYTPQGDLIDPGPITGFTEAFVEQNGVGDYENSYKLGSDYPQYSDEETGIVDGDPVDDDSDPPADITQEQYNTMSGQVSRMQAEVDGLANALQGALDAVSSAQGGFRAAFAAQQAAEAEIPKTEPKVAALRAFIARELVTLRNTVAQLFAAAKATVVSAIEALGERLRQKLDTIQRRMEHIPSPPTGRLGSIDAAVADLFGLHRKGALKAEEYDAKELPAPRYDGRALEALEYDVNAKTHLQ